MTNETTKTTTTPATKPARAKAAPKAKKAAPAKTKAAKGGKKAKHPKAGTVIKVARDKDFQRVKRIGDKTHKVDLTEYQTVVSAGGNSSLDNGDEVAKLLRGKSLDEVYTIVAKHTEEAEKQLRSNYKHLNVGMQRMNLGNKLRGALNAA